MNDQSQPPTTFDWGVYSDATFAGLSVLIPIPLLDIVFESFFRRRMPGDIARTRGRRLSPVVAAELNRSGGCFGSCLTLPFSLALDLLKSLSTKLLYFLAIKAASDQLSYYWHRAFLIDYSLQEGYLSDAASAAMANQAMQTVLKEARTSPLGQLSYQVVGGAKNVLRMLRLARRDQRSVEMDQTRQEIDRNWARFADYLNSLAERFDEVYQQTRQEQAAG